MRAIARACTPEALVSLALACALALSGLGLGAGAAPRAWADEAEEAQQAVDDAQATLDDAEQRMESISDDYDAIKQEVDELQARVDEIAAQALDAQQAVVEGRTALGKAAVYEYRDGGSAQSLLTLVLEARDFNELTRNLSYLGAVMQYHADEVEAQKERSATYEKLIDDLNFQKNEQEKKLQELEAKRAEAESVVSEANSKLENAQSDQASRLEALRKMAEELAAAEGATEPVIDESANTMGREDVVDPGTQVEPNPDPAPPAPAPSPSPDPTPDPTPDPGISWSTGVASAYGGSTDPYTPNPGTTANGSVCDDNSMGVAVPMSLPNFWQYYGRTVEISYNGQTVLATVNDCGSMGGGSRVLDLQPGVWKQFGFTSCLDWGLRTVSYRFL